MPLKPHFTLTPEFGDRLGRSSVDLGARARLVLSDVALRHSSRQGRALRGFRVEGRNAALALDGVAGEGGGAPSARSRPTNVLTSTPSAPRLTSTPWSAAEAMVAAAEPGRRREGAPDERYAAADQFLLEEGARSSFLTILAHDLMEENKIEMPMNMPQLAVRKSKFNLPSISSVSWSERGAARSTRSSVSEGRRVRV